MVMTEYSKIVKVKSERESKISKYKEKTIIVDVKQIEEKYEK